MLGQRVGHPEQDGLRLGAQLTNSDLAAMIGTARSQTGHLLRNFEQAGLIDRDGASLALAATPLREFIEAAA